MRKRQRGKKSGKVWLLFCVCLALAAGFAVNVSRVTLEDRLMFAEEKRADALRIEEAERIRGKELDLLKIEIKSKKFIEDTAREKFGLAYKNEIIFEPVKK